MRKLLPVLLLAITLLFGCASTEEVKTQSFIEVTGSSVVYMVADEASFTVSAEFTAETTDEARAKTDDIINSAVAILKESYGVEDKDIATGYLSLSPYYEWKGDSRVLAGQRGYQSITVTISDISKVGKIVEDLSRINGISVSSIRLDKADKSSEMEEARTRAVQAAIEKARVYAEAAGMEIGDVLFITDSNTSSYNYANDMMYAEYAAEAPKSAGGTSYYAADLTLKETVKIKVEMF